jgi:hypothetical protein
MHTWVPAQGVCEEHGVPVSAAELASELFAEPSPVWAPLVDGPLTSPKLPEELPLVDCSLASLKPVEPMRVPDDPDLPPHPMRDPAMSKPTISAEAPRTLQG